jgi:DNA-binding transcriptional ArsR family regulator
MRMEDVFAALAYPTRRRILDLVATRERAVGELVEAVQLTQPAVSKQLGVLRDAGLVSVRVHGKQRLYRMNPEPLRDVEAWLARYRPFLEAHLDALERHLDKKKSRGP